MSDAAYISFANIDFACPYCGHPGSDKDDKFVNACNRNKRGYTATVCKGCAERIGIAYNYMGNIEAFKLTTSRP